MVYWISERLAGNRDTGWTACFAWAYRTSWRYVYLVEKSAFVGSRSQVRLFAAARTFVVMTRNQNIFFDLILPA